MFLGDVNLRVSRENPGAQASQQTRKKNESPHIPERVLGPRFTARELFVNDLRRRNRTD
jgi:hypothetical protein